MDLKELRKQRNLTQKEASMIIGIPYRTYLRYEEDPKYKKSYKYEMFYNYLFVKTDINETQGILSFDIIKKKVTEVLSKHNITYCYLFGSYARGEAKENSDVDLLIKTDITGLQFLTLIEELRTALNKKVDLLRLSDLQSDNPLILEVLKEGVKIL